MISSKTLAQVEFILRKIRPCNKYFGGIQVILCEDFFQLPPVANELYGDTEKHCFQVNIFHQVFPHRVILNIIYGQSDNDLIQAANELEQGSVSDSTIAIFKSLNRLLPETSIWKM